MPFVKIGLKCELLNFPVTIILHPYYPRQVEPIRPLEALQWSFSLYSNKTHYKATLYVNLKRISWQKVNKQLEAVKLWLYKILRTIRWLKYISYFLGSILTFILIAQHLSFFLFSRISTSTSGYISHAYTKYQDGLLSWNTIRLFSNCSLAHITCMHIKGKSLHINSWSNIRTNNTKPFNAWIHLLLCSAPHNLYQPI